MPRPSAFAAHDPQYSAFYGQAGAYYNPPLLPHTPATTFFAPSPYAPTTWPSAPGPTIIINNASHDHPLSAQTPAAVAEPIEPAVQEPEAEEESTSASSASTSEDDLHYSVDDGLSRYLKCHTYHLTYAPSVHPKRSCLSRLSQAVQKIFRTPMRGGSTTRQLQEPQNSPAPVDGSLCA